MLADQLRESYAGLENKVAERTSALQAALSEIQAHTTELQLTNQTIGE